MSFSDLSTAAVILQNKHRRCRITGEALYSAEFVQWAKDVFAAFARAAWAGVKKAGHTLRQAWALMKAAGRIIRRWVTTARVSAGALVLPEGVRGADLRRGLLAYRETERRMIQRVRTAAALSQRRRNTAAAMQSTPRPRYWVRTEN